MEQENKELFELLDNQAKVLVGVLLRRIELLEKEKVLTPELFKSLAREHIYEWVRTLKSLISIGKVVFTTKNRKENSNGKS